jgi:hypothetical protein
MNVTRQRYSTWVNPKQRYVHNGSNSTAEFKRPSVLDLSSVAAECHLSKLRRLQNRVLRTIGNFQRRTAVRDMQESFRIPYVYDYITKSCRQQAEVIQNHENENVRCIGQGEAPHRKYKRLKLGGGHVYDCSSV